MAIKKFDADTLKKLQSAAPSEQKQPENGTVSPSRDQIREALREANDPNRLISVKPGYYSGH